MQIVWFKRDLRIEDNEALSKATKHGLILPLYILEPKLWLQSDMSYRHYLFLRACLSELDESLKSLGQNLVIKIGSAVDVLEDICQRHEVEAIWSHQETWNGWTYQRDQEVECFFKDLDIPWHKVRQNGVIRNLRDRNGWAARWQNAMNLPVFDAPTSVNAITENSDTLPEACSLGLRDDQSVNIQKGGRKEAMKHLKSFLYERGEGYTRDMSSPVTAFESCSRLSAHLAFGTVSIREVFQAAEKRSNEIRKMRPIDKGKWPSAVRSFSGRLRWHCHFIQKLEDEPRIEFENLHPAYNGLREYAFDENYFEAWKSGMTGFPLVDACMRSLIAGGWINFRMRAMLMSFAGYHLWLHWRRPALYLAKLFTDYEPGIHYSQVQMQSGTTGINTIRIYNPIKQGIDQDPDGIFIRQQIPELRNMHKDFIHTPWHDKANMNGYPFPIVDEKIARKSASDKIYKLRKNSIEHNETAKKIVHKHGSRKSGLPRNSSKKDKKNLAQGKLAL
tara:strand:- start:71 stop:1579 length:1509 start_codon:yes stop_codon:yes gene_type:complete